MVVYRFRCRCGAEWESAKETSVCACGVEQKWFGMIQRDRAPDKVNRTFLGIKMPVESPIEHQRYFNSPEVQAKLRSGEYEIPSKSSDVAHHRESRTTR